MVQLGLFSLGHYIVNENFLSLNPILSVGYQVKILLACSFHGSLLVSKALNLKWLSAQ